LIDGFISENTHLVKDQYFHPPEFHATFSENFVDAGAFTGDTLEKFIVENLGTFQSVYAFEPGARQFKALNKRINRIKEEWAIDENKIHLIQKGLGGEKTVSIFSEESNDAMSHSFSENNLSGNKLQIVTLDEELAEKNITFIKSDIEGMDLQMLSGAKNIILKNRPKLAISCYHYPTDLLNMINFIGNCNLDYKFKLRHHANVIGDYVLYAY